MANAADLLTRTIPSGTWGNLQFETFDLALANGDAIASTHDLAIFPAGVEPVDACIWVTNLAAAASSTLDVGFKSVSGTNQDNTTWAFATTAITAVAFARKSATTAPFTMAQRMFLRCTVRGANQTDAVAATIGIFYRYKGNL
jgi:hypothetical protein